VWNNQRVPESGLRNEASGGAGGQGSKGAWEQGRGGAGGQRRQGDGETKCRAKSAQWRELQGVGEVMATKPAWKRRRASENDDELLQLLADGLGQWIAQHQAQGSW